MVAFEVVAKLARDLRVSLIGACQDFSQCKDGSAKLVPTLQHPVTNVLHLLSELRAVFQPIDKKHRVPVHQAHFGNSASDS